MYFKVLREGKSWHGGEWEWSLPQPDGKGGYTPGEWQCDGSALPDLCVRGFHLTDKPGLWWGEGAQAFVAEYEGAVDGPTADGDKIAVQRCRLLRPATHDELAATGLFLSGEHRAYGNATVEAYGNATVEAYDNATVEAYDNATVAATAHATVTATAHATASAVYTLKHNAVLVDRRNGRPVCTVAA